MAHKYEIYEEQRLRVWRAIKPHSLIYDLTSLKKYSKIEHTYLQQHTEKGISKNNNKNSLT